MLLSSVIRFKGLYIAGKVLLDDRHMLVIQLRKIHELRQHRYTVLIHDGLDVHYNILAERTVLLRIITYEFLIAEYRPAAVFKGNIRKFLFAHPFIGI